MSKLEILNRVIFKLTEYCEFETDNTTVKFNGKTIVNRLHNEERRYSNLEILERNVNSVKFTYERQKLKFKLCHKLENQCNDVETTRKLIKEFGLIKNAKSGLEIQYLELIFNRQLLNTHKLVIQASVLFLARC